MLKKVATFIWLGYGKGGSGSWAVGALERLNLVCISRMRSMYQGSLTPMPGIEQLSPGYGQPWGCPYPLLPTENHPEQNVHETYMELSLPVFSANRAYYSAWTSSGRTR